MSDLLCNEATKFYLPSTKKYSSFFLFKKFYNYQIAGNPTHGNALSVLVIVYFVINNWLSPRVTARCAQPSRSFCEYLRIPPLQELRHNNASSVLLKMKILILKIDGDHPEDKPAAEDQTAGTRHQPAVSKSVFAKTYG